MKININNVDLDELDERPKKEIIKKKPKTVEGSTKSEKKKCTTSTENT